jgi:hydrogenase-4 membrane subunit HyfE
MQELLDALLSLLKSVLDPLEVAMIITAMIITTTDSVKKIITIYRVQSGLLATATGLTAIVKVIDGRASSKEVVILILFIIILPVVLALAIKWLLVRATVSASADLPTIKRTREAEREWLTYKTVDDATDQVASGTQSRDLLIFVALISLVFLIAFQIIASTFLPSDRLGLMVSLTLHLIGLYNMVVKRDIISQVIGLLMMDHGLYLAMVKIVAIPVPANFFVLSLYFYTLITIFILVFLLPQVRRLTGNINLDKIAEQSRLEG